MREHDVGVSPCAGRSAIFRGHGPRGGAVSLKMGNSHRDPQMASLVASSIPSFGPARLAPRGGHRPLAEKFLRAPIKMWMCRLLSLLQLQAALSLHIAPSSVRSSAVLAPRALSSGVRMMASPLEVVSDDDFEQVSRACPMPPSMGRSRRAHSTDRDARCVRPRRKSSRPLPSSSSSLTGLPTGADHVSWSSLCWSTCMRQARCAS